MEPVVAVATALLRAQLPDVTLREGASVMARVASRGEGQGVIVLAGIPLTARLPEGVQAGATLKLHVEEVGPDRVVLRMDAQAVDPLAAAPPAQPPPARLGVSEPPRRTAGDDADGASVTLAFQSPSLGRIDLRIDLATAAVQVGVQAPAGRAFDAAAAASERLRATLGEALERPATVRVTPRREPLDVYA